MGTRMDRNEMRIKRKRRIRKKVRGTTERPRLSVFRSAKHIYAQLIDDTCGVTLVSASTMEKSFVRPDELKGKVAAAKQVGKLIGERAASKGIKKIVFDRNGFLYHGRVKAVAEGAREAGLEF